MVGGGEGLAVTSAPGEVLQLTAGGWIGWVWRIGRVVGFGEVVEQDDLAGQRIPQVGPAGQAGGFIVLGKRDGHVSPVHDLTGRAQRAGVGRAAQQGDLQTRRVVNLGQTQAGPICGKPAVG